MKHPVDLSLGLSRCPSFTGISCPPRGVPEEEKQKGRHQSAKAPLDD